MNSDFDQPEQSPGFMLWRLTLDWQKRCRLALSDFEITHVQFVYLACLQWLSQQSDKRIAQASIAKLVGLDKMVVSETTKKLLVKKLIVRKANPDDGRAYTIQLTATGSRLVDDALPVVESIDREFFKQKVDKLESLVSMANAID